MCTLLSNERVLSLKEVVKMLPELYAKNPEMFKNLPVLSKITISNNNVDVSEIMNGLKEIKGTTKQV